MPGSDHRFRVVTPAEDSAPNEPPPNFPKARAKNFGNRRTGSLYGPGEEKRSGVPDPRASALYHGRECRSLSFFFPLCRRMDFPVAVTPGAVGAPGTGPPAHGLPGPRGTENAKNLPASEKDIFGFHASGGGEQTRSHPTIRRAPFLFKLGYPRFCSIRQRLLVPVPPSSSAPAESPPECNNRAIPGERQDPLLKVAIFRGDWRIPLRALWSVGTQTSLFPGLKSARRSSPQCRLGFPRMRSNKSMDPSLAGQDEL